VTGHPTYNPHPTLCAKRAGPPHHPSHPVSLQFARRGYISSLYLPNPLLMVYVNFVSGFNFVSVSRYCGKVFEAWNISYEPFVREAFWLRYKDYHGLRCVITGARFRFGGSGSTGARCLKLGLRHRIREGPLVWEGRRGPMRAPCGEGPIGADWRDCRPAPSSF
jgi:hypothetical protein